jgi:hypothetical protein
MRYNIISARPTFKIVQLFLNSGYTSGVLFALRVLLRDALTVLQPEIYVSWVGSLVWDIIMGHPVSASGFMFPP